MGFGLSDISHSFTCSKCLKASTTTPENCSVPSFLVFIFLFSTINITVRLFQTCQTSRFDQISLIFSVWLSSDCSLVYWKSSNVYVEDGCEETNWQVKSARIAAWKLSCQALTGWPHMCFQSKLRKEHFRAPREHNNSVDWRVLWHLRHLQGHNTSAHMDTNA